jgi:hypothetical protein
MCSVLVGSSCYCVMCKIAVSSAILETPEDDQCWSKHVACIHSDVEDILNFKTSEAFKKQVSCKTADY